MNSVTTAHAIAAREGTVDGAQPDEPTDVLFFSRGRGRGHAIPDLAIAESLKQRAPEIRLTFASYGTGAETLKQSAWSVIDLGLPEENRFVPTCLRAHDLIRSRKPSVVVSHEEFAALPAAKMNGIPSIYLGDWFPPGSSAPADALQCASAMIVMDQKGALPPPRYAVPPTRFVGPVVRPMAYSLADRDRARDELGIARNSTVVSVVPGSWATEQRAPIAPLVFPAFAALKRKDKRLFWLSRTDADALRSMSSKLDGVTVLSDGHPVERIFVASDVVITKGNRGTCLDAASLGIATVSLSFGQNPVDELLMLKVRSNVTLSAKTTSPERLLAEIERVLSLDARQRLAPLNYHGHGGQIAAEVVEQEIRRLAHGTVPI